MKALLKSFVCIGLCLLSSCSEETVSKNVYYKWVDDATPAGTMPENANVSGNWSLAFSDEFNNGWVDLNKWTLNDESRGTRAGLGIKEWFFKPECVAEVDGNLVLKVKKVGGDVMHCGSVFSNKKYFMKYGYIEARVKVADIRKSALTAFWLQSPNMGHVDGSGHDGAEIDIFETAYLAEEVISTIHIDGYKAGEHQENSLRYQTPGVHNGYHIWGMLWDENSIKIYYDGQLTSEFTGKWVSQVDEFIYLSTIATFSNEGDFKGQPADSWLTEAYFDYVRVWTKN